MLAGINEMITLDTYKWNAYFETKPKYKFISSHIGRRSFATNLSKKEYQRHIMKASGHIKETDF